MDANDFIKISNPMFLYYLYVKVQRQFATIPFSIILIQLKAPWNLLTFQEIFEDSI